MLSDKKTYTTIPVSDLARAQEFYEKTLGLAADMVTEGGVMYGSGGTQFFVYPSRSKASGGPIQMSFIVGDIKAEVAALRARGIKFEVFDVPGVNTVDGIAQSGPAVWTAFFRDPDGNLLGLTQIG
jgi:catechol 2,3-dioxygenase-like lactoylglutathione lyase family enzyme